MQVSERLGRPPISDKPEALEELLLRVSNGESLIKICADEGMPARSAVYRLLDSDEIFRDKYTRAKEEAADYSFEQMMEIADSLEGDLSHEQIAAAKVKIDVRKFYAMKLKPKSYSDRQQIEHKIDSALADVLLAARKRANG